MKNSIATDPLSDQPKLPSYQAPTFKPFNRLSEEKKKIQDLTVLYNWLMKNKKGRLEGERQTGKLKSLIGDEDVGSYLDTMLVKIHDLLSHSVDIFDPQQNDSIEAFLSLFGYENITFDQPVTSPLSGAEVLIIKNDQDQAIAVLKLISHQNGITEIVNSLSANKIFNQAGISTPQTLAVGSYQNENETKRGYYFLMSVASGKPFVNLSGNELIKAVNVLAETLAALHKNYHKSFRLERQEIQAAIQRNLFYEIITTNKNIYYNDEDYDGLNFKELEWLSHTQFAQAIQSAKNKYTQLLNEIGPAKWDKLYTTTVYGDAHIGNFFFEENFDNGKGYVTIIDPETTTWSINQSAHAGDDVGKALASLWIHIYRSQDERKHKFFLASNLENQFLITYFNALGINSQERDAFMIAVNYMKIRYLWMNALESRINAKEKAYKMSFKELIEDLYAELTPESNEIEVKK